MNLTAALDSARSRASKTRFARFLKMPVRMVLPILLRRSGRSQSVRCTTFWGGRFEGILPEDVSTLIYRQGYFDVSVCQSMLHILKPGSVFVDIGAHFGFFSLLGSQLTGPKGKVFSVEAMPSTYDQLSKNMAANAAHKNYGLVNLAGHERQEMLTFKDYGIVNSSLNTRFSARTSRANAVSQYRDVEVSGRRVDEVLAENGIGHVDLVKIDAESSEFEVLKGMSTTIDATHPAFIIEISAMNPDVLERSKAITQFLRARGYKSWRWSGNALVETGGKYPDTYDNYLFTVG